MVIDAAGTLQAQAAIPLPAPLRRGAEVEQDPQLWWRAVESALRAVLVKVPSKHIRAIAVDGTSSTLLLTDDRGEPLGPALMYNDARSQCAAATIAEVAPPTTAAHGASSGLAKLLTLQTLAPAATRHALSPADWITGKLRGQYGVSDEHNCLKLGYDVLERRWPAWLDRLGVRRDWLPEAVPAGTPLGAVSAAAAREFNLAADTLLVAGTTDATAAFIATGACAPGEAVTSLGSTLVVKVLSEKPVFAPEYGVYSHRLGDLWLAGGGSNSGGAVLLHYFTPEQMAAMTPLLKPDQPTGLDYYPLPAPGERFPINDATLPPRVTPRPADDILFFQGLLEGIARIEQRGYQLLASLGAPYPTSILSVGGGAVNEAWTEIRKRLLNTAMTIPAQSEAAYGAALLALRGVQQVTCRDVLMSREAGCRERPRTP
ncbi:MAG: FGGY-family carbohydrate kinase [Gammaproteobacteria bacterium]|nr:FGGY-family carbohydrate kinase [Gammaproteobacteria bacterium]